jgi:hypothetical protein
MKLRKLIDLSGSVVERMNECVDYYELLSVFGSKPQGPPFYKAF